MGVQNLLLKVSVTIVTIIIQIIITIILAFDSKIFTRVNAGGL